MAGKYSKVLLRKGLALRASEPRDSAHPPGKSARRSAAAAEEQWLFDASPPATAPAPRTSPPPPRVGPRS